MNFPVGVDWLYSILPAVEAFMRGDNPYFVNGYLRAPFPFWTFIILTPFALLPFWIGRVFLFVVSLLAFSYTAIRLQAKTWQLFLFLCSAAVIGCLNNGNIDWLVALGLWMPPWLGMFFILMKPQVGAGVALFWVAITWKEYGWKPALKMVAPVGTAYALSFLLYGNWIAVQYSGQQTNPESLAPFPWTIPLGMFILYLAVQRYDRTLPALGTSLVAPYISQFSYAIPMLQLIRRPHLFLLAWVLLWIPVLARLV